MKTQKKTHFSLLALLIVSSAFTFLTATAVAETIAIENVTIHTQTSDGTLKDATLIIEDGEIIELGTSVRVPRGVTIIDGAGKAVTPGLIDAYSYLGLEEISLESSTVDRRTQNVTYGASFTVSSAINANSSLVPINRIEGITHAISVPSTGHSAFAGIGAAVQMAGDDVIINPHVAMFASLEGAPEAASGGSRAATLLSLRTAFTDAEDYARDKSAYAEGTLRDLSVSQSDLEALQKVLNGELPLILRASRASDIKNAVQLAKDFNLRLVIAGGEEAWMHKTLLADNDVAVILDSVANLPSSFNKLGSRLDNAALLSDAGVKVLITDGDSHNSRNIKQLAGNAAANGMPWHEALAGVTSNVAEVFSLEGIGTIEVGAKANLVLWDGEPLEVTTYADRVFIDGVDVPMVSRATLLRDRYMDKSDRRKAYVK